MFSKVHNKVEPEKKNEEIVLHSIISDFYASEIIATPIIKLAEGFLQKDKQAEFNFDIRITANRDSDRRLLTKWLQNKYPIHISELEDLSPREITFLGILYWHGTLVAKDLQQALALFKIASERGDAHAPYRLGYFYASAQGKAKDIHLARYHLLQANEKGCALAKDLLGCLLAAEYDEASASVSYFRESVKQNDPIGMVNLGKWARDGYCGIKKDPNEAFALISKSVRRGYIGALHTLGELYENGIGVSKNLEHAAVCYRIAMNFKQKNSLPELFHGNPTNPCINYQALLAYRSHEELMDKETSFHSVLKGRYEKTLPYSPKIIAMLFSLPVEELEKADSLSSDDIERIALVWNFLTSDLNFPNHQYTNIILEYIFPVTSINNQIKESEQEAKQRVSTLSMFNKLFSKSLKQAQEFKMSYQRAVSKT